VVEKTKDIIDFEREGECGICHEELAHDEGIYTICPSPGCETVTHITCLSRHFLKGEAQDVLVPIKGHCPGCKAESIWADVVKELSLRMRGQKEVEKLLKVKRVKKAKSTAAQAVIDSDGDDEAVDEGIEDEAERLRELNPDGSRMEMGDGWAAFDDSDSDLESVLAVPASFSQPKKKETKTGKKRAIAVVIEDSDWDEAIALD
jgi:structure-specific endonuclease subunit SLX1